MTSSRRCVGDDRRRQEAVPQAREDRDAPFRPPPIASPYRCPVCGTELLGNAAILDVGIGMAQFQHVYYPGFMPKVGCPGCHGDTME
jgi:hypothetical protein